MDEPQPQSLGQRLLLVGIDAHSVFDSHAGAAQTGEPWTILSVKTAADAIAHLEKDPIDVVLAPVWLSDINGVDFLDRVMERWPKTIRILLSDSALLETAVRGLGKPHHHILDPWGPSTVTNVWERIAAFKSTNFNPQLPALIARMSQLPSPPETYFQVLAEMRSAEGSIQRIGQLIVQDPALSAKVLQFANSAVFGLQLQVMHPVEAVGYLGLETTKALLLLAHTFSYFENVDCGQFSVAGLQYHSLAVGGYAQRIAQLEGGTADVQNQAFTAGLLHDIGKLFLAANMPEEFGRTLTRSLEEEDRGPWEVESELLGANHAEVGGSILNTWLLPNPIVDAVARHHCPPPATQASFSPLIAVYAANILEHESRSGRGSIAESPDEVLDLGDADRWTQWRRCCMDGNSSHSIS